MFFIKFHGSRHVGAVTKHYICTCIDTEMSKASERASIFSTKYLAPLRKASSFSPFSSTMKTYNNIVAAINEIRDNATHRFQILMSEGIFVMPKRTKSISPSTTTYDGALRTYSTNTTMLYTYTIETGHSREDSLIAKVMCMIIGHAQIVEACLF